MVGKTYKWLHSDKSRVWVTCTTCRGYGNVHASEREAYLTKFLRSRKTDPSVKKKYGDELMHGGSRCPRCNGLGVVRKETQDGKAAEGGAD